jgi:hypothetical protein
VIDSVVIEKATSDESENSPLAGDGNTRNEIVITSGADAARVHYDRSKPAMHNPQRVRPAIHKQSD